ncbi:MAG: hypothetical protein MN733_36815, partial [Nitrososphaera sp.]|nr:hypothetical protein [Nitrososphaera sp.]
MAIFDYRYALWNRVDQRPRFEDFGLRYLHTAYAGSFFEKDPEGNLTNKLREDEFLNTAAAKERGTDFSDWYVIDVEHLAIRASVSAEKRRINAPIHKRMWELANQALPKAKLGSYGSLS